jgi:hypothetical protein
MSVDTSITFEERDEYNRKPIAEKIIRLLSSDVDVSPLIIDGDWGTGKTEFCHKLINLIDEKNKIKIDENDEVSKILENEKTNIKAIYVDAFKADHADEPLMTLLAAVLRLFPDDEDQKSLKDKALPVLRFGAKTISKGVVSWVLQQDFADIANDIDGVIKNASNQVIDKTVASMLDDHVKAEQSIETLKTALEEVTKDSPIVIFVDELDRCRPDFAISMLESIKHIFDVEGVQFVLVLNNKQLKSSVNHCYGSEVLAEKYLDKFVGFKLPISTLIEVNAHEKKYAPVEHFINLIFGAEDLKDSFISNGNNIGLDFSQQLIHINKLSLREVETFVKYIRIYNELTNNNLSSSVSFGIIYLRILGIYLFCFNNEMIDKYEIDYKNILKILSKEGFPSVNDEYFNPSKIEIIAAMVGLEADLDINQKDIDLWNKQISLYFNESRFRITIETVLIGVTDVLTLKN